MKKITLFLGFSLVGLIGFSQQIESSQKLIPEKKNTIQITIAESVSANINTLLILGDDQNEISFENNSHELVHNTIDNASVDYEHLEEAFTFNEYAINYDFKTIKLKY